MKNLFILLLLLMTVVTGTWAQIGLRIPLTLEATTDGTIMVYEPKSGMKYSKNGAIATMIGSTTISVTAGDKVQFYGNGTSITCYRETKIFGGTAKCIVYGNIMSLVDEENFDTATTLIGKGAFERLFEGNAMLTDASGLILPATILKESCYEGMFKDCTSLTTAPALRATNLAYCCYSGMFDGCSSLTAAPALPAFTLAECCYENMFYCCTSLTSAPALPATKLAEECYCDMFNGCTGLIAAPELPATTLTNYCYRSMFEGCTGLIAAPELPATELAAYCYKEMFYGCTKLASVTCLATDIRATDCTTDWLSDVAATGVFIAANDEVPWKRNSASGIPSGWTREKPSAVNLVKANTNRANDTNIYNLQGRKFLEPSEKGVYIMNSKKIVIK